MGRVIYGFCDGCDFLDTCSLGLICQILGGGCIRVGHPDNVKEEKDMYDKGNRTLMNEIYNKEQFRYEV